MDRFEFLVGVAIAVEGRGYPSRAVNGPNQPGPVSGEINSYADKWLP
jgi:hypothetical protein